MTEQRYKSISNFVKKHCPRQNNFCDGTAVKGGEVEVKDLDKCEYYKKGKCQHPKKLVMRH